MALAGSLEIQLAADVARLSKDMGEARRIVSGGAQAMQRAADMVKGAFAGIGVAAVARQYVQMADAVTLMEARLRLATKGQAEFLQAQKDIADISARNNAGIQETATLYTKLSDPVRALGGGTKEVAAITDAFAATLRVSGASTAEASAATLQFAQAMASGVLRGDEFNSIAEANPRLLKALAAGMGVPTGALREMAKEGKLAADVVGNALVSQLETLRKEGESIPLTVGAAMQALGNQAFQLLGDFDKLTGGSGSLADMLSRYVTPALKGLYSVAVGVQQVFKTVGLAIGGNLAAIGAALRGEFGQAREILDTMRADIRASWEQAGASINQVWAEAGQSVGLAANEVKRLTGGVSANAEASKKAAAEAKKQATAYDNLIGKVFGKESGVDADFIANLKLINEEGKKRGLSLAEIIRQQEAYIAQQPYMVKAEKDALEIAQERQRLRNAARAQEDEAVRANMDADAQRLKTLLASGPDARLEAQRKEMLFLADQLKSGNITEAQFKDAATGFLNLRGEVKETKDLAKDLGLTFSSAFEDAIVGGKKFSEVLQGLGQDVLRLMIRKSVTEPLANSFSGMFTSLFSSFDGGGYTGNGPRSGGLDGKGGFMALMHPQETVTDHTKGQSTGRPITIINNITTTDVASKADVIKAVELGNRGLVRQMRRAETYGG